MLKYNNSHIFTGYLKSLLSAVNIPACKIYTREFAKYLEQHGTEDPRIIQSFDNINDKRLATRISYLKNDTLYNYFSNSEADVIAGKASWKRCAESSYSIDKAVHGTTKNLNSLGNIYDAKTHEYLGEYLRFLRDYYNINLMSLYNCFNDKIYTNVYFNFIVNQSTNMSASFDSQDPYYKIYAIPVKLFSEYTIAIDSSQGVELFCGFYNNNLDTSSKAEKLAMATYQKVNKAQFSRPFLYSKLSVNSWQQAGNDIVSSGAIKAIRTDTYTRWDIASREKDLRLFIKIPVYSRSTVTILEGDYRAFNDNKYAPISYKDDGTIFNADTDEKNSRVKTTFEYRCNHNILNFNTDKRTLINGDGIDLNNYNFKPISKLQLLALNTGESYPFADRLIEYLSRSAITPIDEISDNIKRVQRVMRQNNHYFKIEGLWENKMQNILYDYLINSGPIDIDDTTKKVKDFRQGRHRTLGHSTKSNVYDVLGYVDKDAERLYASWKKLNDKAVVGSSLQNIDIYDGLYDI